MIKPRKAQGLSLTTIIIAILVIIVMVVLIMIFTGRMNLFGKAIDACEGDCVVLSRDCPEGTSMPIPMDCNKDREGIEYCCKPVS